MKNRRPNTQALIVSMQENFNHARRQHQFIERFSYIIILFHSTAIGYFIKKNSEITYPKNGSLLQNYSIISDPFFLFISIFLLVISILIYLSTLKWSAEFMNHFAVIKKISEKLNLIKNLNNKIKSTKKERFLPENNYIGYVGMPLSFPILMNFSALMVILDTVFIIFNIWFIVFWFLSNNNHTLIFCNYTIDYLIILPLLIALFSFVLLVYNTVSKFNSTKKEIKNRYDFDDDDFSKSE